MSDDIALLAAILAQPAEDTPRLAYADLLDERGLPGDSDRATFIRKQIELFRLGDKPLKIDGTLLARRGPQYWEFQYEEPLRVGSRVDLTRVITSNLKSHRDLHQLLVTKCVPDPTLEENWIISLKQDEQSRPYPYQQAEELRKECFKLMGSFPQWVPSVPQSWHLSSRIGFFSTFTRDDPTDRFLASSLSISWERGFLSCAECTWHEWTQAADLIPYLPISRVKFTDTPLFTYDSTHVVIEGVAIPFSHVSKKPFDPSRLDEYLPQFLACRWPTIPPEGWILPIEMP